MAGKQRRIAVEVENRILVPIMDLSSGTTERTVPLTTLVDNQRRALVNVYLVHGPDGGRTFLKQFDLDNLPPRPARQQRFFFTCTYDGRYSLRCRLSIEGEVQADETIHMKRHIRGRRRSGAVGGILLVLLAAALLAALALRGCRETPPAVQTPAAPSPAPSPAPSTELPAAPAPAPSTELPAAPAPAPSTELPAAPSPAPSTELPAAPAPAPSTELPAAPTPVPPTPPRTPDASTPPVPTPDQPAATGSDSVESEAIELHPVTRDLVIYFFPDDPRLTEESREQLRTLVREISGWESVSIEVEGHCAPLGSEAGRVALSRGRAENSAAYLEQIGLPAETVTSISWYAGERPVTDDPDRQDLNRRVELSVRGRSTMDSG